MLDFEENNILKLDFQYKNLRILELGNQITWSGITGKQLYTQKGAEHVSLDLNGRDGALTIDFGSPLKMNLGLFDLVTDYGTIEHVNNQYQAFKNIHSLCKTSGLMIHVLPKIGHWPNHGRYYFSIEFFEQLSLLCSYEIIDMKIFNTGKHSKQKNVIGVVYKKSIDCEFLDKLSFMKIKGVHDSGSLDKTGNYKRNTSKTTGN